MIPARLRSLRESKGLSKKELVDELPYNYSTYANYESGFREPNSDILRTLADYFGVSLDYLLGVSDNKKKAEDIAILTEDENEHIENYRLLDEHGRELVDIVLQKETERVNSVSRKSNVSQFPDNIIHLQVYQQKASAGLGNYLSDDSDDDYEEMTFADTPESRRADFCVRIAGDSMEPKIGDGDIVFVKASPKVDPDNIGIFIYDGEAYCKKLKIDHDNGRVILESLNRDYEPKEVLQPENLRTVGLVIGKA